MEPESTDLQEKQAKLRRKGTVSKERIAYL